MGTDPVSLSNDDVLLIEAVKGIEGFGLAKLAAITLLLNGNSKGKAAEPAAIQEALPSMRDWLLDHGLVDADRRITSPGIEFRKMLSAGWHRTRRADVIDTMAGR
jgi:hypothetical protein